MSEAEFWNSDPIFFNECYNVYMRRKMEEAKVLYVR